MFFFIFLFELTLTRINCLNELMPWWKVENWEDGRPLFIPTDTLITLLKTASFLYLLFHSHLTQYGSFVDLSKMRSFKTLNLEFTTFTWRQKNNLYWTDVLHLFYLLNIINRSTVTLIRKALSNQYSPISPNRMVSLMKNESRKRIVWYVVLFAQLSAS